MSYAAAAAPKTDPDIVSVSIGNQTLSGWQDVRVTRGVERFPSDFSIRLTEKFPTAPARIDITPGAPIQVKLGADLILTGYVDRYSVSIDDAHHEITVTGRSKCQDLVDCSAKFPTMQTNSITIVGLANMLARRFGISVVAPDGDSAVIPTFNVTLTETPYEILEQIARWAQFLVYDNTAGDLVIATLADTNMASGFVEGQNVQRATVSYAMDSRYTEIDPVYLATTFLIDPPQPLGSTGPVVPNIAGTTNADGNFIPNAAATDSSFPNRADGSLRYRPLIIVSPQTQNSTPLAARYAAWEMARRFGRSQQIRIRCDSWRDSAGALWAPNALAPVNLPSMKLTNATWLISEVTFNRDEQGTTADVVLMPRQAFAPQPTVLVPYDWQIGTVGNAGASTGNPPPSN